MGLDFAPVYIIGLMDFCFSFLDRDENQYLHRFLIRSEDKNQILTDKLEFIFIELPKFKLAPSELQTDLEQWLYFFRHLGKMCEVPSVLNKGIFKKLITETSLDKFSKSKFMTSEKQKRKWDAFIMKKNADLDKQEAYERGREEGEQRLIHLVQFILKQGTYSPAEIASLTGLNESYIEQAKASME